MHIDAQKGQRMASSAFTFLEWYYKYGDEFLIALYKWEYVFKHMSKLLYGNSRNVIPPKIV
jgi:hypothetical protein